MHMSLRSSITPPPWKDAKYTWDDVARVRVRRCFSGKYRVDPDMPELPEFSDDPDWEGWSDIDLYMNRLPMGEKIRLELLNGASEDVYSQVIIIGESAMAPQAGTTTSVVISDPSLVNAVVQANETLRKLTEKAIGCNTDIVMARDAGLRKSTAEAWQRVGAAEAQVKFLLEKQEEDGALIKDLSAKLDAVELGSWEKMPIPERIALFREGMEMVKGAFNPTQKAADIFSEALLQALEEGTIPEGLRGRIGSRTHEQQKKIGLGGVKLVRASVAPEVWKEIVEELINTMEG